MDDADADQQGIWPIEVSGKATRDARTVHRTTHQTEFDEIVPADEPADIPIRTGMGVCDLADLMPRLFQVASHPDARVVVNLFQPMHLDLVSSYHLADLMLPGYLVARQQDASSRAVLLDHANGERQPDQYYMQQMHSDLVSSRHIELLTHADGERELPFIPLKQVVAHQLMLDLAAGVIWRNLDGDHQHLELVVPPPPHFAGDAAPDQLPELVDHSDDEMPELEPDSDDDKLVNGG